MKLYVQGYHSYTPLEAEIKKELKREGIETRRKDALSLAGILGAISLQKNVKVCRSDELYLSSGANANIIERVYRDFMQEKGTMRLFDFINILGNSTGFYVAEALGLKSKTLFGVCDSFAYFHRLIGVYASLKNSQNDAIVGSIDYVGSQDAEVFRRLLGVREDREIFASVSFEKLSLKKEGALASLEFDTQRYNEEEFEKRLKKECLEVHLSDGLAFSRESGSFYIHSASDKRRSFLYVESCEGLYKILKVESLV